MPPRCGCGDGGARAPCPRRGRQPNEGSRTFDSLEPARLGPTLRSKARPALDVLHDADASTLTPQSGRSGRPWSLTGSDVSLCIRRGETGASAAQGRRTLGVQASDVPDTASGGSRAQPVLGGCMSSRPTPRAGAAGHQQGAARAAPRAASRRSLACGSLTRAPPRGNLLACLERATSRRVLSGGPQACAVCTSTVISTRRCSLQ